ncbi:MAG: hypothetical protein KAH18_12055 [Psychromonas sp.]|nr:hypothetical protein [Psychromonas sp.]
MRLILTNQSINANKFTIKRSNAPLTRRHSTGARMLTDIPLSGSLLKLATKIWEDQDTITTSSKIYDMYNRQSLPNPLTIGGDSALSNYYFSIHNMALLWGKKNEKVIFLHNWKEIPFVTILAARSSYLNDGTLINNPQLKLVLSPLARRYNITIEDYLISMMKRIFISFAVKCHRNINYRVYVNVNANEAIKIMSFILFYIVDKIDGIPLAKIGLSDRTDMIIIYTNSLRIADEVVKKLKELQDKFGTDAFRDQIPLMTSPQIQGIAIGAEPPQIYMADRLPLPSPEKHGFGHFRSDLIFQALNDSKGSPEFFELIVKYFRDAGLDASDPAIQTRFYQLQWEAQRNLATDLLTKTWEFYQLTQNTDHT